MSQQLSDLSGEDFELEKKEYGVYLADKETQRQADAKDERMARISKLCSGKVIKYHPNNIATFMRVIKNVARKHNLLNQIPTEQFKSHAAFLEALITKFEKLGVPEADLEWITKTFETMDSERVNK